MGKHCTSTPENCSIKTLIASVSQMLRPVYCLAHISWHLEGQCRHMSILVSDAHHLNLTQAEINCAAKGFATNMLRVLWSTDENSEVDPLRQECNRRLVCTMILMDRLLSFPPRLSPQFSTHEPVPPLLGDDDFWAQKRRTASQPVDPDTSVNHQILILSKMLDSVCYTYRRGSSRVTLEECRIQFDNYTASFYPSLIRKNVNL
jgi:hypothetical protein